MRLLTHTNILQLFDVYADARYVYLVTERCIRSSSFFDRLGPGRRKVGWPNLEGFVLGGIDATSRERRKAILETETMI